MFAPVGDQCEKGILLDVLFVIDLRKNLFYLGKVVDERMVAYWCTPKLLDGFNFKSKGEDIERKRSWGVRFLACSTLGVEGCAGTLGWD